jgi:hypothetical protein
MTHLYYDSDEIKYVCRVTRISQIGPNQVI